MEGEGGNERRGQEWYIVTVTTSVSVSRINNDPHERDLWRWLPTRVVKHSSDQNHQSHQNIPGSFHPWSVPERTP